LGLQLAHDTVSTFGSLGSCSYFSLPLLVEQQAAIPALPLTFVAEDIREVEEKAARQRQQQAATPKGKRVASVGSMPTPD